MEIHIPNLKGNLITGLRAANDQDRTRLSNLAEEIIGLNDQIAALRIEIKQKEALILTTKVNIAARTKAIEAITGLPEDGPIITP